MSLLPRTTLHSDGEQYICSEKQQHLGDAGKTTVCPTTFSLQHV
jgi:hypothetical protein